MRAQVQQAKEKRPTLCRDRVHLDSPPSRVYPDPIMASWVKMMMYRRATHNLSKYGKKLILIANNSQIIICLPSEQYKLGSND